MPWLSDPDASRDHRQLDPTPLRRKGGSRPRSWKPERRRSAAITTMTTLMEGTLTTTRLDAGKINIEIKAHDLRRVVADVCARQLVKDHQINCDLAQLPEEIGGPRGLERVFANLLSNAIKYSPARTSGSRAGARAIMPCQRGRSRRRNR